MHLFTCSALEPVNFLSEVRPVSRTLACKRQRIIHISNALGLAQDVGDIVNLIVGDEGTQVKVGMALSLSLRLIDHADAAFVP